MEPLMSMSNTRDLFSVSGLNTQRNPYELPHHVNLKWKEVKEIESGRKTVFGKAYSIGHRNFSPGDEIIFHCWYKCIKCQIEAVRVYQSFEEMAEMEGVDNCLQDKASGQKILGVRFSRQFDSRYRLEFFRPTREG